MPTYLARRCILWLCFLTCTAIAQEDPRLYTGAIEVPGIGPMEMTLGISETDEGSFILLTLPIQGVESVPLPAAYTDDGEFRADIPQAGIVFVVSENDDNTVLQGRMEQAGITLPIEFKRIASLPIMLRPQTPAEPYPYGSREVTAMHPDGHMLAGTLTIPQGEGPFPCAVLISGSGQQDRDETVFGHRPFLVIADDLTRKGLAVLRFDDRGVGGSVMDNPEDILDDTSADFATDVDVMVHAARIHPEIDSRRVGVIGHSEGGLIGPMVAVKDDSIAFVVMLAGPGVPGYELLPVQQGLILKATGVSPELVDRTVTATIALYELMRNDASEEELRQQTTELVRDSFEALGIEMSEADFEKAAEEALEQMDLPWMQFFLMYDPLPVLAQLRCPVLAMNGTLDLQVSSTQNLPPIERAIQEAGGDITIVELQGMNHLFQLASTGSVSEYATIETTIDPIALTVLGDWLLEVTDDD